MIQKVLVIGAVTTLAVALACSGVETPAPDAPCNVAAEQPLNVADPQLVYTFVAEASENLCVHIVVNATDQLAGKGHNPEGGSYPWEGVRPTPYFHHISAEPGLIISASFRVYTLADKTGGWVACSVRDAAGNEIAGTRTLQNVTGPNSSAVCLYTLGLPK